MKIVFIINMKIIVVIFITAVTLNIAAIVIIIVKRIFINFIPCFLNILIIAILLYLHFF